MIKKGTKEWAASKVPELRALRARKRRISGSEGTFPAKGAEIPQLRETYMETEGGRSMGCKKAWNNSAESLLTKGAEVGNPSTDEVRPLTVDSLEKPEVTAISFPALKSTDGSVARTDPVGNSGALLETQLNTKKVLEEGKTKLAPKFITYREETTRSGMEGEAEAPQCSHAECPQAQESAPGHSSPLSTCDTGSTEGEPERNGKRDEKSHHPAQSCGGKGTSLDRGQLQFMMESSCRDTSTRKRARKRMGMWGFREPERRSHCEGQLRWRQRKGANGETRADRQAGLDSGKAVVIESQGDSERCKNSAGELKGQTIPNLSLFAPLDAIHEEEEPSQPLKSLPSEIESSSLVPPAGGLDVGRAAQRTELQRAVCRPGCVANPCGVWVEDYSCSLMVQGVEKQVPCCTQELKGLVNVTGVLPCGQLLAGPLTGSTASVEMVARAGKASQTAPHSGKQSPRVRASTSSMGFVDTGGPRKGEASTVVGTERTANAYNSRPDGQIKRLLTTSESNINLNTDRDDTASPNDVLEPSDERGNPSLACCFALPSTCKEVTPCPSSQAGQGSSVQSSRMLSSQPDMALPFLSSQLHTVALSQTECHSAPKCIAEQDAATKLVCGLIKELSFLNRVVMAAHRELDNMRRGNRTPKHPLRQTHCPRHKEI